MSIGRKKMAGHTHSLAPWVGTHPGYTWVKWPFYPGTPGMGILILQFSLGKPILGTCKR
ncbi:hypothetical protein SISSUDRAFT_835138 [Sistotremastrum suecicum HHB10207 ss-3]|uniref:Uncharacterized protein n=1 Tax=Sistotremastrum suecicum HHB10207 ss-3 TaxID=1314776 RepID=A0A166CMB2_9AGAM|nr:hypothetical protein SISSUDRAFT_919513 [Sistotremastrum suecicum HHB10207 ss-3]KZT37618.1 hypothetical protein SISSUDRAFT_835138 [Sistotremastrum suecicum HHB10207 ss-3]